MNDLNWNTFFNCFLIFIFILLICMPSHMHKSISKNTPQLYSHKCVSIAQKRKLFHLVELFPLFLKAFTAYQNLRFFRTLNCVWSRKKNLAKFSKKLSRKFGKNSVKIYIQNSVSLFNAATSICYIFCIITSKSFPSALSSSVSGSPLV